MDTHGSEVQRALCRSGHHPVSGGVGTPAFLEPTHPEALDQLQQGLLALLRRIAAAQSSGAGRPYSVALAGAHRLPVLGGEDELLLVVRALALDLLSQLLGLRASPPVSTIAS